MNAGDFRRLKAEPHCGLLAVIEGWVEECELIERLLPSRWLQSKKDLCYSREFASRFAIALSR